MLFESICTAALWSLNFISPSTLYRSREVTFMKKRLLTLLFAALLLTSTVSCSGTSEQENETTTLPAVTETATAAVETEPTEADVPEKDYAGKEFRIFTRGETTGKFWHKDLAAEELNGDPLNDAVYNRNIALAEKLNVKITPLWSDTADMQPAATKSITAGDDAFEVMMAPLNQTNSMATKNYLLNLNTDIPYLDLEKPWWDGNSVQDLSIGDTLYSVFGDYTIMDEETTWVMYFNKDIQKDHQLENFYELVETGNWTNDKLHELSLAVTTDVDGDGDYDYEDLYGYQGEQYNALVSLIASDVQYVHRDENNMPVMIDAAAKERLFTALESTLTYMNDLDASRIFDRDGWGALDALAKFREGGSLFMMCGMINVMLFRDMDADFGVLPIPKTDAEQDGYYSTLSVYNADAMSIPVTISDPEMIGIVMETFSAESRKTVLPAYYDVALTRKSTRDEESRHMIDIIIEGKRFDVGMLYDIGGIASSIQKLVMSKSMDIASMWASIEKSMATALEDLYKDE